MAQRSGSPVFVGRDAELAELAMAYQRAVDEGAAIAIVAGEAGIGKSRLVGEFTAALGPAAREIHGECLELGSDSLPFAPFLALVRRLWRQLGVESIRDLLPRGDLSLTRWLPELGPTTPDGDPLHGRARLFDEILTLLERAATARPLVVVLEDLHWADVASLELLDYLVRNLDQPGLLLICTYRPSDRDDAGPLRAVVSHIRRQPRHHVIEPRPLTRAEVGRQLAWLLRREPDAALVALVHERSDGNPLFVEALASDPAAAAAAVPQDLLAAAVAQLPDTGRAVLRAAAVTGRACRHALLEAVCGVPEQELDGALRELVDRRVLVVTEDGYFFRHALMRDAVYDGLLPGERRRLHVRCAEAVSGDPGLVPHGQATAQLAMHWSAAGDDARALEAAWQAAAAAQRSYAHEQQLRMLERVLELWGAVPEPERRLGVPHAVVLQHAVRACLDAGAFDRGIGLATRALDELDPAVDAEFGAQILTDCGVLKRRAGHGGDDDLEAALRAMPADAPYELRGRTLAMLAVAASRWDGDPQRALPYAEEALRLGREHDLLAVQATALIALGRIAALSGDPAQALARFQEAGVAAEAESDHYGTLTALLSQAYTMITAGDYTETITVAGKGLALAHRAGQMRSRGVDLAAVLAEALWRLGRWPQARAVIEDALAEDPPRMMAGSLLGLLAELDLAEGSLETATTAGARARSLMIEQAGRLPVFAAPLQIRLALARGDVDAADQVLLGALADPGLGGPVGDPWTVLRAGVQVQRALRSATEREKRHRQLREAAQSLSTRGPLAAANRATFEAEIDGAEKPVWDASVTAWLGLSVPFELAWTLFEAAEADLVAGARANAEARLVEAASLASDLGAHRLRHEIELLAARGRIDFTPRKSPAPQPEDGFGLTARELDVLRLLTEGMSNRQLAAALFISSSTAGVHVSRILAKLGVSRRTEAAALAHRLGMFAPAGSVPVDTNPTESDSTAQT